MDAPAVVLAGITSGHGKEEHVKITKPFQLGPGRMAPTKKGGENKGRSAINEVMSRQHTLNTHKYTNERASGSKPLRHSKRFGNWP